MVKDNPKIFMVSQSYLLISRVGGGGRGVMKKFAKNGPRKVQNRLKWFILSEFKRVVADF